VLLDELTVSPRATASGPSSHPRRMTHTLPLASQQMRLEGAPDCSPLLRFLLNNSESDWPCAFRFRRASAPARWTHFLRRFYRAREASDSMANQARQRQFCGRQHYPRDFSGGIFATIRTIRATEFALSFVGVGLGTEDATAVFVLLERRGNIA